MSKIVIETQYMPTIAFYSYLNNAQNFFLECKENYQKGSYRNKCAVLSSQGSLTLSVPLKGGKNNKTNIKDVHIDYSEAWTINHLRALKSCYGKSPYYEFYIDGIETILDSKYDRLFDLNLDLMQFLKEKLDIETEIGMTEEYESEYTGTFLDRRNFVSPKSRNFERLALSFDFISYDQVFSDEIPFEPNLSILDLLFCQGPEAKLYLNQINKVI